MDYIINPYFAVNVLWMITVVVSTVIYTTKK